ncbi:glycoside hydrolase superfamily [Podospora appendiculata]|uniref:alpha-galactosidase n=1 Tax=Podospora appendiculata TaxID=314037 RepID=A0AAE1C7T5_9PEZI|nr:glycoside hydrolase superfamily [Podospora appendiculata]
MDKSPYARRDSRKQRYIIGVCVVVGLALALGLGIGLGNKHSGGDSGSTASPTSAPTASSLPSPASLWQPAVNVSWQIVLAQTLNIDSKDPTIKPDVDVFDIDMFTHQNTSVVDDLHRLGKKVICYFSAGSYEPYRPDSHLFNKSDLGHPLQDWPDEIWLNISSPSVRDIMVARIDIAHDMGCDAIDPDNLDGYQQDNGLDLTSLESIDYITFLAEKANAKRMSAGLKNAGDIVTNVLSLVQFSVNEECVKYTECSVFSSFIKAGKPVFHIEYPEGAPSDVTTQASRKLCSTPGAAKFSTVLKTKSLNNWVEYCNGEIAMTDVTAS